MIGQLCDVLQALARAQARVIIAGGVALQLQGSSYITSDVDVPFERTRENAKRIAGAIQQFEPHPRDFPSDFPFSFDAQMLLSSEVLTLQTTAGDVDFLGEIKGIGAFADVLRVSETLQYEGFAFHGCRLRG